MLPKEVYSNYKGENISLIHNQTKTAPLLDNRKLSTTHLQKRLKEDLSDVETLRLGSREIEDSKDQPPQLSQIFT